MPLRVERLRRARPPRRHARAGASAADQDLARRSGLLEARRDIHRVARDERLAGGRIAGHDLARVHADPRRKGDALVSFELLVEPAENLAHLGGRAGRAKGIVLVHTRDPEHRHDGVADELLDGSAVAFDRRLHLVEVAGHHPAERLGIELLAERGRAGDVAEDHRDRLALLASGLGSSQRRTARRAEREVVWALPPTGWTGEAWRDTTPAQLGAASGAAFPGHPGLWSTRGRRLAIATKMERPTGGR